MNRQMNTINNNVAYFYWFFTRSTGKGLFELREI